MLKELSEVLVNPITTFFNLSFTYGMFPNECKLAAVIPIFKGGHCLSISNYRPVSILPLVSKLVEKLVAEQITNNLNTSAYTLHPHQFGFHTNYSTDTANCYCWIEEGLLVPSF